MLAVNPLPTVKRGVEKKTHPGTAPDVIVTREIFDGEFVPKYLFEVCSGADTIIC